MAVSAVAVAMATRVSAAPRTGVTCSRVGPSMNSLTT
jgi:hypothetical protein